MRTSPIEDRIKSKVVVDQNGCWKWVGAHADTGYGMIWKATKHVAAHRESYRVFKGPVLDTDIVCHSCDVRDCVNPDHLFLGDRGDNNRDMFEKRRHRFGEASPHAKLSIDDAKYILERTDLTATALAKIFNVNQSTVSRIRSGKRWSTAVSEDSKHISDI